jgi:hypothetical protein
MLEDMIKIQSRIQDAFTLMNVNFGLEELMQMVGWHVESRPEMTAQDVYKLLFQGVCGAEHIMPAPEIFAARLQDELATLQPDSTEPLCEWIRPDHELSRINLRAYIAKSQDTCWLVEACLRTGELRWGTRQDLVEIWQTFLYAVQSGYFPRIDEDKANSFNAWVVKSDYPAVHHSSIYEKMYLPAYRLVATEYLRR